MRFPGPAVYIYIYIYISFFPECLSVCVRPYVYLCVFVFILCKNELLPPPSQKSRILRLPDNVGARWDFVAEMGSDAIEILFQKRWLKSNVRQITF